MAIVMETIQHKFNWFSLVVGVILFVAGIVTFIHLYYHRCNGSC